MGIVDGKIAIVTGAGRGVGRGEAHGAGRPGRQGRGVRSGWQLEGRGHRQRARPTRPWRSSTTAAARPSPTTTTSPRGTGADAVVQLAIDTYGGLDVVVNNAGILRDALITKMTEDDWDGVIGVHLKGTFNMTHHACV